jgi:hypothetical protein
MKQTPWLHQIQKESILDNSKENRAQDHHVLYPDLLASFYVHWFWLFWPESGEPRGLKDTLENWGIEGTWG